MPPRSSNRPKRKAPEHAELPNTIQRQRPPVEYLDAMSLTMASFPNYCYELERYTYTSEVYKYLQFFSLSVAGG